MNSRNSGRQLESFFAGRGFYIVLFLCAAVIGISAWMTAAGNETMSESNKAALGFDSPKIETVVLPPVTEEAPDADLTLPIENETDSGTVLSEVWHQGDTVLPDVPEYIWPVSGQHERGYCSSELRYDVTLQDWRTHEAIDICAPIGEPVLAAHSGTVQDVYSDELYGTVMVISHGDSACSIYANLDPATAVQTGSWVNAGDVIGAVGSTALCEVGQSEHLHFAMKVNDSFVDPADYLPA